MISNRKTISEKVMTNPTPNLLLTHTPKSNEIEEILNDKLDKLEIELKAMKEERVNNSKAGDGRLLKLEDQINSLINSFQENVKCMNVSTHTQVSPKIEMCEDKDRIAVLESQLKELIRISTKKEYIPTNKIEETSKSDLKKQRDAFKELGHQVGFGFIRFLEIFRRIYMANSV
jgi:hypothetical protein